MNVIIEPVIILLTSFKFVFSSSNNNGIARWRMYSKLPYYFIPKHPV